MGNRAVQDVCVRKGCWLRSDSIPDIEEPVQVEMLANRPPWLAVVMEDGGHRDYNVARLPSDAAGINVREKAMLHDLKRYNERFPRGFATLEQRMGYRVRPSWVWERKRYGTSEVIVSVTNDGVAGVPGVLRLSLESLDGKFRMSGGPDAGDPYGGASARPASCFRRGWRGRSCACALRSKREGLPGP